MKPVSLIIFFPIRLMLVILPIHYKNCYSYHSQDFRLTKNLKSLLKAKLASTVCIVHLVSVAYNDD